MPRSAGTSVENNFSRGLVTEATAMNYPENSVIETDNCVYLKNGTVLRRNGIDFESTSTHTFASLEVFIDPVTPDYNKVAIQEFEWVTLGQSSNKVFLVVQVGDVLRFFEIDNTNKSAANLKTFNVRIEDYRTTPVVSTDIASATGNIVVNDALIASLDGTTLTVTVSGVTKTITFAAAGINTKAEFEAALDTLAIDLNIIAEVNASNFLHISALENDITTSFTVGGTANILTAFGIAETTYNPDVGDVWEAVGREPCHFSSGLGYLFVVHPFCQPIFVEYNEDLDTITVQQISVEARDFERLDDSLDIDERTTVYSDNHFYNLYNQGWYATSIKSKEVTTGADDGASVQVLTRWLADKSNVYPSNSDIWWLYKNSLDRYDPLVETTAQLSAPAPNGHYIYSAFQTNRRNATGSVLSTIAEKSSGPYRPSRTAFFSSRVWYAGINTEDYSSSIYFSKLIEDKQDFGKCYQASDPTSESTSEILEIDGGVIVIPDIIRVTGLVPIGRSLIVFASNGVWAISGSQGGFKANDYSIQKISESPVDAPNSIVVAENKPYWWGSSGIYTILVDTNSGELTVENISDAIIKKHVLEVPAANIQYIKGIYNTTDKTIQWLYRMTAATTVIQNYQYTEILVHDVLSKAFYPHSISTSSTPYISGAISSTKSSYDALTNDDSASSTIYIVTGNFGAAGAMSITMAKFKDTTFKDWASVSGGVDFESYFITGYRVRAELLRKFQANYLVVMAKVDTATFDDYGCILQGIWDYNNSSLGRLTREQQVYLWSYNMDYSRRKLKIRGNGYSLQFKFKSQTGKKFILTGWVSSESAANVP